jgi:chromosome segregation ATPase
MLQRLRIRNFQIHKDVDLIFDPKITSIIGQSDVGKSSLLRAIRWLALNKPRGDGFMRVGESSMTVAAKFGKTAVRRHRDKSDNLYQIGKEKTYRAFGNDVPNAVQALVNLDEINFQQQHDPPFWFSLSAPEVGRQLNKIVDLEVIDRVTKKLSADIRSRKAALDVTQQRLDDATELVEQTSFVKELDEELSVLETRDAKIKKARQRAYSLAGCLSDLATQIKRRESLVDKVNDAEAVIKAGKAKFDLQASILSLRKLIDYIGIVEKKAKRKVPNLSVLEIMVDDLKQDQRQVRNLRTLLSDIRSVQSNMEQTTAKLSKLKERFKTEFGGVCPVCGSEWNGD